MKKILQQASFQTEHCQVLEHDVLYSGFLQVEKLKIRHQAFNQTESIEIQRELIHRPHAAGALLYNDQQQRFLLIEQFRAGAIRDEYSPWQLEIIAGVLDGNESPESCIRRECLEEAGCQVTQLQHIFTFYPSAGACSELFDLFVAQCEIPEVGQVFGMPDEGENILVHIFDYADLDSLLSSQRLRNAPVIMALQWLKMHIATR